MSEVYWITGVVESAASAPGSLTQTTLKEIFKVTGIGPEQLDAVFWIGGDLHPVVIEEEGIPPTLPFFTWPGLPLLDHFMLHDACRSILSGDCDLIVIGQQLGNIAGAALLASPKAVGRHNLMPRAKMAARLALGLEGSPISAMRTMIDGLEQDNKAMTCLAPVNNDTFEVLKLESDQLHDSMKVFPSDSGTIVQMNRLAMALEDQHHDCGLLVSSTPGRPILASLLQRV
jgi:hypothetical protein